MKFQKETLVLFVNIIISFYLGFLLWDHIKFAYSDPGILGAYSENNHNSLNDIVRYLSFILLPILAYVFTKIYFGFNFRISIKNFLLDKTHFKNPKNIVSPIFLLIILLLIFLEFLSITFPEYNLDSFHEGQKLSSAFKSFLDNSLWSGSFVTIGIFFETLSSKFFWQIFNQVSIGITRYSELFYIFLLKISLVFFIFFLSNFLKLNSYSKNIFFILNALILNYLINYIPGIDLISYRELPIILLSILFLFLIRNNHNIIVLFLISLLSVTSLFWGIDRGLVCNLLISIILIYLFLIDEKKKSFLLFVFIFCSWLIFFIFANNEFYFFIENTFTILKEMNYIHGLIHPKPFSGDLHSSRSTKVLLFIIFVSLICLNLILNQNKDYSIQLKRIFLLLCLLSITGYLYALGRSDGPHIKNSFGYPLVFLSIYLSYNLLIIVSKKKIILNKIFVFFVLTLIFSSTFYIDPKNIASYKKRFNEFINQEDDFFLNEQELTLIENLKPLVNKHDCIQLISNDAALYYLLKKKSCTKYYYVWNSSSNGTQIKLVEEMKNTNIIIAGGPRDDWDLPLRIKLNRLYEEVDQNFVNIYSFNDWNVYLRK
tara:strand:- start:565 stop:2361 length:1797 start_codon:yes stop_codon:yes gene_type:complete